MTEVNCKLQSKYAAFVEAKRLESFAEDKNFLPVYASSNAKIYPYQILAARFALRSDYLKGCILCDEASLGKTYEALLVIGQKWFEGKENILVILPNNLVEQWLGKIKKDFPTIPYFYWNGSEKKLKEEEGIAFTTYDIATKNAEILKQKVWDIIVFDEADILSNPTTKVVQTLKDMAADAYKLLLTPTPITMSIMDIYGLIHFIDESVLPDADKFYKRYYKKPENYHELTEWVSKFCFRTLKCQAADYVNFSRRIPITVNYKLTKEEKLIYDLISAYIISDNKAAYPEMDNYNLNLLFFKTISSSPRAFSKMLEAPIKRAYGHEKAVLEEIKKLTDDLWKNSKVNELLTILDKVFSHLKAMKVNQKAIIFAENNTTLDYLHNIFYGEGYNTIRYKDERSIEKFRNDDDIQILITNDEAAKGLDIEFCPVVVNYDLPYDSVKIEQRICRCHRQGQESDVLVINMLSKENLADVRILELINKRTLQFNGIFGMSDDILGNFDTKIKEVLKDFRHKNEVQQAFQENLIEHKESNEQLTERTEDILFTTFTKSIAERVSINPKYMEDKIEEINQDLWELVKYYFTFKDTSSYEINDDEKTLTKIQSEEEALCDSILGDKKDKKNILFYYFVGRVSKPYYGRDKYGLAKDFKPHYNRITFTSPLAKGLFDKWNWSNFLSQEAIIYLDKIQKASRVGLFRVVITNKDGYQNEKNILVGQDIGGEILSENQCRELLKQPVINMIERTKYTGYPTEDFPNPFSYSSRIDELIDKNKIINDYLKSKESSFEYKIEKLKFLAGRKKADLEAGLRDLKSQISELKAKLDNKISDRLEELELTKQLRILENDLRHNENDLFFDMAQVDLDTEQEIKDLTDDAKFQVSIDKYFELYFLPNNLVQLFKDK